MTKYLDILPTLHSHGARPAQTSISRPLPHPSESREYLIARPPCWDDILIACHRVMGAAGSGKTTVSVVRLATTTGNSLGCLQFINLASGSKHPLPEGLEPRTTEVQLSDEFTLDGTTVTLVDAPGFDSTLKTEAILEMIADFLANM